MRTATWHGTAGGYSNHACRCDKCTDAWRIHSGRQTANRLADRQLVDGQWIHPDATHGTRSAYTNYGCRCDECRAANARYSQQVSARKAVA